MSFTLTTDESARMAHCVRQQVRDVPDFPKPGILFRDITPVLADPTCLKAAIDLHAHHIADLCPGIDVVVGIESRGFLFGMTLAAQIGAGFVVVRKPGKLPAATLEAQYELEYGTDALHIHADAIRPGQRVVIVDDLLATGGTASAAKSLVERLEGKVEATLFLIELTALQGRKRLEGTRVEAILEY